MSLDLDQAAATFAEASDLTVGVEEEFSILDPRSLELLPRFEELRVAAEADPILHEGITGELICSEIEIISGAGADLHDALARQRDRRGRLFALAGAQGVALGATGTHPWADYREQPIIDTEHYRRVEEGLKYVAWRNNTFSLHVHVGVRDIDRAIKVCDRLRGVLPLLLAISANSPYLDGVYTGLHSARTQSFTKSFPRCGVPDVFGGWQAYREYIEFLVRTRSIVEFTQVWWSVRPHFSFGTVEVRICDAQATAQESDALAALMVACIAQAMRDVDEGVPFSDPAPRLIEENMWRAIRYGLDGRLIDLEHGAEYPAREAIERLCAWTAPLRGELGIEPAFPERNGAQRQRRMIEQGDARGRFQRVGEGDSTDLLRGGDGVSTDPSGNPGDSPPAPGGAAEGPSEAELRAAYEAELSRITPADMMLQAAVSLLNLGARRLGLTGGPERPDSGDAAAGPPGGAEHDLGQVRDAIDGVRALLAILERSMPEELRPLRDALSQLQIAYAREAPAPSGADRPAGEAQPDAGGKPSSAEDEPGAPGPAQSSGRLWVPGS